MRPWPRSSMPDRYWRVSAVSDVTFSWIIPRIRSGSSAANAPKSPTPALFTSTSTSGRSAAILPTAPGSERSAAITRAPPSSVASASSLAADRATRTRSWSGARTRAISIPIPPDAPVTSAVAIASAPQLGCADSVRRGRCGAARLRLDARGGGFLAGDRGAVHGPAMARDIAHRHVLHDAVVPERDVADGPAPPARERVLGGVVEEDVEQDAVLGGPPLVQPDGVLPVHVQRVATGLWVATHHRVQLHAVGVVARVHGHAREHVVDLLHLRRVRVARAVDTDETAQRLLQPARERLEREVLAREQGVAAVGRDLERVQD